VIIDPHYHLMAEEYFPDEIWTMLAHQMTGHVTGDRAAQASADQFRAEVIPRFWDPDGERLLAKMSDCGIDQSVLLADDFGVRFGGLPAPLQEQNKAIADLAACHPGRLIPFCSVDPRRPDTLKILSTCIEELGMRGIGELHPDTGWEPSGPEAYRMLSRVEHWDVPILIHTGLFFPPLHSKYDLPMYLDDVCADFPDLKVIAAHAGRTLWWREVAHLAGIHPNLYAELAGFQTLAVRKRPEFRAMLREFIDICGADKILWATDDPVYDETGIKTSAYLDLFRHLPDDTSDGITFTQAEISAILGENAARILKL